ncbi:hypothetical protein ACHAXS_013787 [Conticribra weissflogii]
MSNTGSSSNNNNSINNSDHDSSLRSALAAARAALDKAAAAPNNHANSDATNSSSQPSNRGSALGRTSHATATPKSRMNSTNHNSYPLPANCRFVPGGVEYLPSSFYSDGGGADEGMVHLSRYCNTGSGNSSGSEVTSPSSKKGGKPGYLSVDTGTGNPGGSINAFSSETIIRKALVADAALRKYSLLYFQNAGGKNDPDEDSKLAAVRPNLGNSKGSSPSKLPGHRLPSLSILAESALVNPLTAVPPSSAVHWAECMILESMDGRLEQLLSMNGESFVNEDWSKFDRYFESEQQQRQRQQQQQRHSNSSIQNHNYQNAPATTLVRRATLAAWAAEQASTGRTPTHSTTRKPISNIEDMSLEESIHLPLPSLSSFLRSLHRLQRGENPDSKAANSSGEAAFEGGPCGYVFRRGDIAWNCRTCQTDATCVLCDRCFRESDHEGHEVFFHRTTPGGCCDCGDREAWRVEGCCPRHRPPAEDDVFCVECGDGSGGDGGSMEEDGAGNVNEKDDDFEAVRAAKRGRLEHERIVDGIVAPSPNATEEPKPLPPRLAAALGVVLGAVVRSVMMAYEGSAIGADVSQWRLAWADEICRVWNGVSVDEEYYRRFGVLNGGIAGWSSSVAAVASSSSSLSAEPTWTVPEHVLSPGADGKPTELPKKCGLFLRLHNDDVHTYEEVTRALNGRPSGPMSVPYCGRGNNGQIGGAGMSSVEFKALSGRVSPKTNDLKDNTIMDHSYTSPTKQTEPSNATTSASSSTTNPRSFRNRSLSGEADVPERQNRRFRGEDVPAPSRNAYLEIDPFSQLVTRSSTAEELTRRVDADGQVLVREYKTIDGAGIGFSRLRKDVGLHASVMTTPRLDAETRAKLLLEWLAELLTAHPAVSAIVVQALVDVTDGEDILCVDKEPQQNEVQGVSRGVAVWTNARMLPCWSGTSENWWGDGRLLPAWRRRLDVFPPHLESSYLTREEGRELYKQGLMSPGADRFATESGTDPNFYANIPYSLPDSRLYKSPHSLWGSLPLSHIRPSNISGKCNFSHPLLRKISNSMIVEGEDEDGVTKPVFLRNRIFVIDTDLRKYQEGERLTASLFPHRLEGLNLVSGVGHVSEHGSSGCRYGDASMGLTSKDDAIRIASCSSYKAPISPVLLLLLFDPYTPKLLRSTLHRLFLKLLTDSRFKSRFAASLGSIVHRPTSTLFCAGVGTEADTLLSFTVQLFTTGSLVRALGNLDATTALLCREDRVDDTENSCISALPIAHGVVCSIHTNILGASRETARAMAGILEDDEESISHVSEPHHNQKSPTSSGKANLDHPLSKLLPAASDDKFIDSRCMKHKRIPHLLRDLEYIFETSGTAVKLLKSWRTPSSVLPATSGLEAMNESITQSPSFSLQNGQSSSLATYNIPTALDFSAVWARFLRLGQGIDLQKRKVSGGHVEYENDRWLGAYGMSLNLSGTGDALSESPFSSAAFNSDEQTAEAFLESSKIVNREAIGNLFAALFREIKMWLYREGLQSSVPIPHSEPGESEALQRSTLHVSVSQLDESSVSQISAATGVSVAESCDVACEVGVKILPESKLALLEAALLYERSKLSNIGYCSHGVLMGDWLKVPHSPLAGDGFSFHLPLHRALARSIRCYCSAVVPTQERVQNPDKWWRLPLLDDDDDFASSDVSMSGIIFKQDNLSSLVRPTHKSANLRVMWSSGPECSPPEAQLRRSRSRMMSNLLASTKVIHSLCDHPLRCIAAAQQIDHHMWARNGSSLGGMALNYGSVPLCRSLRDLDLTMVQLSSCGFNVGLGARRVFALLTNRFSMDGYLCDPDRRVPGNSYVRPGWVKPPRMQDPEHAELLAESFFTTVCIIVSDLPPPPPSSLNDDSVLRQSLRRELLHALAVEPRSHSEAMAAASTAVSRRDESDSGTVGLGGGSSFRSVFTEVLQSIAQQRNQGSRASSGPPLFELKPDSSNEYDPSFYHLRRTDHQHAMDNIARLRKQKLAISSKGTYSDMVLPLVSEPPECHPRFLPSRLLLHLPPMYAAIRRYLMYALFDGNWLPPSAPEPVKPGDTDTIGADAMLTVPFPGGNISTTARREAYHRATSSMSNVSSISSSAMADTPSFSPAVVAASSKSFLEVLHILTLQVHTLEECSSLQNTLPFLDHEQKKLSSRITIDSYLSQLIAVPSSLVNVWALLCAPDGPLPSKGSGENRGSVLGLLIALYEHRDHGNDDGRRQKSANDDHGGARTLSADGLKWLLRFVNALIDGAESVDAARQSATTGIRIKTTLSSNVAPSISNESREKIKAMLSNLPELWPGERDNASDGGSAVSEKSREARKAAQARALAEMKKKQASFAASISSQFNDDSEKKMSDDDEENLCIICKCDDDDGDNGPMGYLGHVQRSRVLQLASNSANALHAGSNGLDLSKLYRVVGDKGCQLRSTESMDSAPVAFLPRGSIVEVLQSRISPDLGLLSRRVLVRHVFSKRHSSSSTLTQGWASVQSWQGYVILSPLSSLCYTNTRWGATRPVIRQCGHAAHLRCVEAHCLSLHQRSADNQPYDGRFSANIDEGEFLCPLCKQLSNILIPEDVQVDGSTFPQTETTANSTSMSEGKDGFEIVNDDAPSYANTSLIRNILVRKSLVTNSDSSSNEDKFKATLQFGSNLLRAMQMTSVNNAISRRESDYWHPALRRWDFEDDLEGDSPDLSSTPQIGSVMRLMRQELVAWAAVGHSAAAAEASARGVRQVLFGEVTYSVTDPWVDYAASCKDSHPMLLELRRSLAATASLTDAVTYKMTNQLSRDDTTPRRESTSVIGSLLCDILEGRNWMLTSTNSKLDDQWKIVTALIASMVCHVSKEDTVAPRVEARSVAAAMWALNGSQQKSKPDMSATSMDLDSSRDVEAESSGNIDSTRNEISRNVGKTSSNPPPTRELAPPKPLSIYRVERNLASKLESDWGTLDPSMVDVNGSSKVPFRPAVANAFLYVPLLAWDLNTLAGGLFSCLLSNLNSDPCISWNELLHSAKVLLVARLTQVLSTPNGFLPINYAGEDGDFDDFDDENDSWDHEKKTNEAVAVNRLLAHCRGCLAGQAVTKCHNLDDLSLLHSVGNALLPYCRSLVLLLRASASILRQRMRRASSGIEGETDAFIVNLLADRNIMTIDDGMRLFEAIGAPLPSTVIKESNSDKSWFSMVTRWLKVLKGFNAYHGTRGGGLVFDTMSSTWVPVKEVDQGMLSETTSASFSNLHVESSSAAVEVAHISGTRQETFVANEDRHVQGEDAENEVMDTADDVDVNSDEELEHIDMDVDFEGSDRDDSADDVLLHAAISLLSENVLDVDDDASDVDATLVEPDGDSICGPDDRRYCHVSRAAIIPFQSSILGDRVGPGPRGARGETFDYSIANQAMSDLSHLGMIHLPGEAMNCLVKLPRSFVELYGIVNRIKGRDGRSDDVDDDGGCETAICLVTGAVMKSGSIKRMKSNRPPGACTLHARKIGSGVGIFFLVQKCTVLLMHNNKSAYSPSLYVDEHGEEDPGLRRGRPLFFSDERFHALENLWRSHGIPREVSQIRSTSDRVIRDNWY